MIGFCVTGTEKTLNMSRFYWKFNRRTVESVKKSHERNPERMPPPYAQEMGFVERASTAGRTWEEHCGHFGRRHRSCASSSWRGGAAAQAAQQPFVDGRVLLCAAAPAAGAEKMTQCAMLSCVDARLCIYSVIVLYHREVIRRGVRQGVRRGSVPGF